MLEEYPRLYTVSALTREIKARLENDFPLVWVRGEISNLRMPLSGHYYFTLKDEASQLKAVLFRGSLTSLRFKPSDTQKVICRGRITVYEPRGDYQLLVDYLEPLGIGALAQAFEELKARLAAGGLFDPIHKKPLPFLPQRLAVVTSPSGAAVRDFLKILDRRFPNLEVLIYPVKVQGVGAAAEIAEALETLNTLGGIDVLILTRGGGSIEDLWAFNEEIVARAIFNSQIPVISAIGHEIDFTIADFVADVRASTPTAAAELVVRRQEELRDTLGRLAAGIQHRLQSLLQGKKERLSLMSRRLSDPRRRLVNLRLRLDDRLEQLWRVWQGNLRQQKHRLRLAQSRLSLMSPRREADSQRQILAQKTQDLRQSIARQLNQQRQLVSHLQARLQPLNPLAILDRGYAVVTLPDQTVIRDLRQVQVGGEVHVRVAHGCMDCQVKKVISVK
jgi:exodeoxyribonuclease VII large subunit